MSRSRSGIALPSVADAHGWLLDGDGGLSEAIDRTKREAEGAVWQFAIGSDNVYRVEALYRLSRNHGALLRFSLEHDSGLDSAAKAFIEDFVRRVLLEDPTRSAKQRQEDRALLQATASEGGSALSRLIVIPARILYRGCRALIRDTVQRRLALPDQPQRIECPMLIGAYGGEHVGDAAILGGVLLELHQRFGTRRALLGSFRPVHTARLVNSLEVPVEVRVFDYTLRVAEQQLRSADALVFAGGPLMDLPDLLVLHWNVALAARSRGLAFIIDRIGVGPFARSASRFAVRRLARLATSISVRTSRSADEPELRGLEAEVRDDPAFAYLKSRGCGEAALTKLRAWDRRDVVALLQGAEGKFRVGINLRPIRHLWSPKGKSASRRAELQCLDRLAQALVALSEKLPVRFIFFPMNPIQLGGSDLQSAWQLHKLLNRRADFRVWQGDPEIDGLLHLLRELDAVVAMRFHGCIFAMSQGLPTLGIDYYPHAGGKVEALFSDRAAQEDCVRIDTLDADWLIDRLLAIARTAGYAFDQPPEKPSGWN